jgi:hypothetical protein
MSCPAATLFDSMSGDMMCDGPEWRVPVWIIWAWGKGAIEYNAAACEGSTSAFRSTYWSEGRIIRSEVWSEGRINLVNERCWARHGTRAIESFIYYYYFRSQYYVYILYYMVFLVGATPTLSVIDHASSKPMSSDFHHGKMICVRVTSRLFGELCEESK